MLDVVGPLHLRPFKLADAAAVEPWLSGPGLSLPAGRLRREWPKELLADARIHALIAESRGRRVGFVRLDCGPDRVAEITLVIAPECRRLGWGGALFAAALEHARRLSLRGFVALVDHGNLPALAFFGEQGFVADGTVGDRVRMQRFVHAGDGQPPLDIDA